MASSPFLTLLGASGQIKDAGTFFKSSSVKSNSPSSILLTSPTGFWSGLISAARWPKVRILSANLTAATILLKIVGFAGNWKEISACPCVGLPPSETAGAPHWSNTFLASSSMLSGSSRYCSYKSMTYPRLGPEKLSQNPFGVVAFILKNLQLFVPYSLSYGFAWRMPKRNQEIM